MNCVIGWVQLAFIWYWILPDSLDSNISWKKKWPLQLHSPSGTICWDGLSSSVWIMPTPVSPPDERFQCKYSYTTHEFHWQLFAGALAETDWKYRKCSALTGNAQTRLNIMLKCLCKNPIDCFTSLSSTILGWMTSSKAAVQSVLFYSMYLINSYRKAAFDITLPKTWQLHMTPIHSMYIVHLQRLTWLARNINKTYSTSLLQLLHTIF